MLWIIETIDSATRNLGAWIRAFTGKCSGGYLPAATNSVIPVKTGIQDFWISASAGMTRSGLLGKNSYDLQPLPLQRQWLRLNCWQARSLPFIYARGQLES